MRWTVAEKNDLAILIDFILEKEWEHTFVTCRLIEQGAFALPSKTRYPILILKEKTRIKAACMVSSWGGVFPVFKSIDLPDEKEMSSLIFWLKKHLKRIYSIMGTEERVQLIRSSIDMEKQQRIRYNLMVREHNYVKPIKPHISDLKIIKACPDDAAVLLGLELKYQREEVFLNPTSIKNTQIYHYLRTSLNEQEIFYVTSGITPIAKAGTNAIGHKWNQVGGVYTDTDYRKCGLSTWLMDYLLDYLEQKGKKTVLFVKESNKSAEKVYNKLGFENKKKFNIIYYN